MAKTDNMGSGHPFFSRPRAPITRTQRLVRVRATGARFSVGGRAIEAGTLVEVPEYAAAELIASGKAEYA